MERSQTEKAVRHLSEINAHASCYSVTFCLELLAVEPDASGSTRIYAITTVSVNY